MRTMGILASILMCVSLFQGLRVESVTYDSAASLQCVNNPMGPLYNGGVIQNNEFNNGLTGWLVPWGVTAVVNTSHSGNKFVVSRSSSNSKNKLSRSVFQKFQMQSNHHYALSAWFQVTNRSGAVVKAVVKAPNGNLTVAGGVLVSRPGCWTMLKGGVTAHSSGPAELSFEADEAVDIMVDNVSLQPFSLEEWSAHRNLSVDRTRRSSVEIIVASQAATNGGKPLANATVRIALTRPGFPFGNAMTGEILHNPAYEEWFTKRFTVTTFENEMKWYSTEMSPGHEDYRVADAMLRLAEAHGIQVRGHNVFWDDASTQMSWVKPLDRGQLAAATRRHARSVVPRYAGKVIAWDVVNENLHFDFFESRLGANASSEMYQEVGRLDGGAAALFMNDYGTLEQPVDPKVLPTRYAAKMEQIRAYAAKGCYVMCLTDNNFRNLPVGDVVDKIIAEWRAHTEAATTNIDGVARVHLVHGDYNITVTHPSLKEPVVDAVTVNASSVGPIKIKV